VHLIVLVIEKTIICPLIQVFGIQTFFQKGLAECEAEPHGHGLSFLELFSLAYCLKEKSG
jgi:hypothetical protein